MRVYSYLVPLVLGSNTYEGKFFIMHDGLSQWWEKEAQEYMEMLGFKDRQIKCLPPANEGNRYAGKLVGNRPELMPLDAHLFSDFTFSFWFHCSVTSLLAPEDPRRFNCGTPKELCLRNHRREYCCCHC